MGYPHFSTDCTEHHSLVRDSGPLVDIAEERERQDKKWGEQNHPDGTGTIGASILADEFRRKCDTAAADGTVTWGHILIEEFAEALAEKDPVKLRAELVQVAAVAVNWVEAIDRRPERRVA